MTVKEESVHRKTILIVDDEPVSVKILCHQLEKEYSVIMTHSGREALEAIAYQTPDIILLDLMMPEMDGYEVYTAIRMIPALDGVPVLFITVSTEVECEAMGLELGANDFLHKPFNCDLVRLRIKNHLAFSQERSLLLKRSAEFQEMNIKLEEEIAAHVAETLKRKQAETELKASEYRWKFALEGSGDGVWDWDITSGETFYSRRYKEILGFGEDEIGTTIDEWTKRIHPDDAAEVTAALQQCLDGKIGTVMSEFRMACKDGSWRWILGRGMVVKYGFDGKPVRMIGTHSDINERIEKEGIIRKWAFYDPLTGLANRRLFTDRLEQAIATSKRHGAQFALLFLDMDNFKDINDSLGHQAGDEVLVETGKRIRACCKRDLDTIGRHGGDEFSIILTNCGDRDQLAAIAAELLQQLSQPIQVTDALIPITTSIGISVYPHNGTDIKGLEIASDRAMYAAKKAGRNTFRFWEPYLLREENAYKTPPTNWQIITPE
ncbi:MAG TPA: diguanylate cyclase [Desulfuromonadales bacterium]|nr:diguanylate cyclase [Desulfuromonadales bacterium]